MFHSASAAGRRLPVLLLLGLLALLLWGQCALLLPGSPTPPSTLEGSVKSTDSLRLTPPALLLTLRLRNTCAVPVTVQQVSGALRLGSRSFPFSATQALQGRQLLVFDELTQAVAIPLPLRADSLALMRALLHAGQLSQPGQQVRLGLVWQLRYTIGQDLSTSHAGRASSYLPPLTTQP